MRRPAAGLGPDDLRMPVVGLLAWGSALAGLLLPRWCAFGLGATGALLVLWQALRRPAHVVTGIAWLIVVLAVLSVAALRREAVAADPLTAVAGQRAAVSGELLVLSDPVSRHGRFGDYVTFRARTVEVVARGRTLRGSAVLVVAPGDWSRVTLGSRIRAMGRLGRASDDRLAAVIVTRGPPRPVAAAPGILRAVDRVRQGIRDAVSGQAAEPRALVPALVDGDDGGLDEDVQADFRVAGLTHVLAVSGTNLTLIAGLVLALARWCGVRGGGLIVAGLFGVVGFVLLARTEPSVLRAAVMGSVALVGMGAGGRRRGIRSVGVAVLVLLLADPWLAVAPGFALSVLATAGIILLGPPCRDALARWLPRWVAEAVAVPLAAQIACTPVVAVLSGQVSLVAVVANLLAAPVVGPATVLGLLGGLLATMWVPLGRVVATPAGWCAEWIVTVAERSAAVRGAAVDWPVSPWSIALLVLACGLLVLLLPGLLARRAASLGVCCVLLAVWVLPLPTASWPPPGWVMTMCDVGQGDALVLAAGRGRAVVVDAGPDARAVDRCLDRLGVEEIPLLVLTHFHADHVDGIAGVLRGRRVGRIETSPLHEPAGGDEEVRAAAARAGVPVEEATVGETGSAGPLRWQVLAPSRLPGPESDSPPNDASVALLVETHGIRLLLLGDEEVPSQRDLARGLPGLEADVLKVAHHGSGKQDPGLIEGLGARLALVSVGRDNDYGHPAALTLRLLEEAGMRVRRTDLDGDVAVVVDRRGRLGSVGRS